MFRPYFQHQGRESQQYWWQQHEILVILAVMAGKLLCSLSWWQHKQPQVFHQHWGKIENDKRFKQRLQWQHNTLKQQKTLYWVTMMKHFMTAEDLCVHMWQSFSIILTLSHPLQSMITTINTAGVKQGANNSFTTNNYSNTSTQHMTIGDRHQEH